MNIAIIGFGFVDAFEVLPPGPLLRRVSLYSVYQEQLTPAPFYQLACGAFVNLHACMRTVIFVSEQAGRTVEPIGRPMQTEL